MVVSSSGGEGEARRLFDGAYTAGEILLTSTTLQRKQKTNVLFASEMPRQAGPLKTSERARPHRSGGDRTSGDKTLAVVLCSVKV